MNKVTRIIVVLLATLLCVGAFSTTTFAASSLASKAEKAKNQLVSYGEYQGWTAEVGSTKTTGSKAIITVTLRNSKHFFGNIAVTSTAKKTYYRYKGKNYSLNGWKNSLKKYAVGADKKALLKTKAKKKGDSITKYAKGLNWTTSTSRSYKNGRAYYTLKVKNAKKTKTIVVIAQRKNGKVILSYKLGGKSSSLKAIKNWLSKYSYGYEEATDIGPAIAPPAPAEDEIDTITDNPDYSGPTGCTDSGLTGEPVPVP